MPEKSLILIVEDEESLANTLALNLKLEQMEVLVANSGPEALRLFQKHFAAIHLVLLDVMLPGISGFDLFPEFKKINSAVPIIFLTARGQAPDKISGLKLGAHDYIVKPFDLEELLLRVKNILKRNAPAEASHILKFGNCTVNFDTYEILDIHGKTSTLSKREIGLLKLLTARANKVISRDEIIEALWEPDENASARTIDNYILNFRKHFENNPRQPEHFLSIRSVGYKFVP
jgi:two-component system, OmpR family, alkaline phosphatase synthesis response regulator PhoP